MAIRPVFLSNFQNEYVREVDVEFKYYPGFSVSQKQRCINSLHQSFLSNYDKKIIEISSKSLCDLGVRLSAFNLCDNNGISVECKFQSSKIFEKGGPYKDILNLSARGAKKDLRLRNSGLLKGFEFNGHIYPLTPKTAFYDWIYINTLWQYNRNLAIQITEYDAFTDIEFNPKKSLNCQARALAMFVTLFCKDEHIQILNDFEVFADKLYEK